MRSISTCINAVFSSLGLSKSKSIFSSYPATFQQHRVLAVVILLGFLIGSTFAWGPPPKHPKGTPGTECNELGLSNHFLWCGECYKNHALLYQKVDHNGSGLVLISQNRKIFGRPSEAVDGSLETRSLGSSVTSGIAWWEIELKHTVRAQTIVLISMIPASTTEVTDVVSGTTRTVETQESETSLTGAIVAISNTVKGDNLMYDTSPDVSRFYLKNGDTATSIKVGGKPMRYMRVYKFADVKNANEISKNTGGMGNAMINPVNISLNEVAILDTVVECSSLKVGFKSKSQF